MGSVQGSSPPPPPPPPASTSAAVDANAVLGRAKDLLTSSQGPGKYGLRQDMSGAEVADLRGALEDLKGLVLSEANE